MLVQFIEISSVTMYTKNIITSHILGFKSMDNVTKPIFERNTTYLFCCFFNCLKILHKLIFILHRPMMMITMWFFVLLDK